MCFTAGLVLFLNSVVVLIVGLFWLNNSSDNSKVG